LYLTCAGLLQFLPSRFLLNTNSLTQYVIRPIAAYHLGGMPALVWTWALPMAALFHVTSFTNAAGHVWGSRPYATGGRAVRRGPWGGVFAPPARESWPRSVV
jgi:fatty-acid desaturase